jgi:sugar O-acyltransferase (sialic acid O-acetyltransferase NeuD family)
VTIPIAVVGAGGHGRECLDVIEAVNTVARAYDILGVVDDDPTTQVLVERRGGRFLGPTETLRGRDVRYVLGIGDGAVRRRIDDLLTSWGLLPAPPLVHPRASVGSDVDLAPGVVLAAGARITTNVRVGRHSQLNIEATVSHDCRLGDFVTVSPAVTVCGTVTVGDGVLLGAGATVIQDLTIGDGAVVGAGAVVVRDVEASTTVVGVPAAVR